MGAPYGPNNLRKYREAARLRQLDVAHAIGHNSSDRISMWEHGTAAPHLVNLFKLSALYKASVEELYGEFYKAVAAPIPCTALDGHVGTDMRVSRY